MRAAFSSDRSRCVFSSEWDKYAMKTYQENYGEIPYGDINSIEPGDIPDHDLLIAGFPCQPFSTIGKREGFLHKTQGTLFHSIVNILEAKKPFCLLLENIPGLMTHDQGKTFQIILETLDLLNYDLRYAVLDASIFNLPQVRERIYIVGFKRNYLSSRVEFSFPMGQKNEIYIADFIETNVQGYSIIKHLQNAYLLE